MSFALWDTHITPVALETIGEFVNARLYRLELNYDHVCSESLLVYGFRGVVRGRVAPEGPLAAPRPVEFSGE